MEVATEMSAPDPRMDQIADAIRGAIVNLQVALRLYGELRQQGQQQETPEDEGPRMFGKKAPFARPTTAVGAESQQSEGLDHAS